MPAIPSVDRNGTNEKQVALRRPIQRKMNTTTVKASSVNNGQARATRVTLRSTASTTTTTTTTKKGVTHIFDGACTNKADICNGESATRNEPKTAKRGKRSLTLEKERISPRSVKILRRSHLQSSSETVPKLQSKLQLPYVKKSSKTP